MVDSLRPPLEWGYGQKQLHARDDDVIACSALATHQVVDGGGLPEALSPTTPEWSTQQRYTYTCQIPDAFYSELPRQNDSTQLHIDRNILGEWTRPEATISSQHGAGPSEADHISEVLEYALAIEHELQRARTEATHPETTAFPISQSSSTRASVFWRDPLLPGSKTYRRRKRYCEVPGCVRGARSRGRCKAHGGGRRCQTEGCPKSDQGGGHCVTHGGGKRCKIEGCTKAVQWRGLCKTHGGTRKCRIPGCTRNGQYKWGACRVHYDTHLRRHAFGNPTIESGGNAPDRQGGTSIIQPLSVSIYPQCANQIYNVGYY